MALQKIFISIFIACIVSSCIPSSQNVKNDVKISVEDVEFRQIVAYHNTRNIDALYPYLRSQNPALRYNVAKIFASIRDSMTLDSLYLLLNDPIIEVKGMAAYAIGQIGAIRSADRLILAFKSKDTLNVNNIANAHILEAVGKIGNTLDLKNLATIRTYRTTDTFLITSLSKAIFRMALRGITDNVGTDRMVDILYNRNNPYEARLYAAYYLSRAKNIDISGAKIRLTELYNREENTELLIPLAIAIGKTKDLDYLPLHKTQLLSSADYRLKVSVLKTLAY